MNKDGLFSRGGIDCIFDKKGKEWKEKNHLMSHITQTIRCEQEHKYEDCAIVELELKEVSKQDIGPILQKKKQSLIAQDDLERIIMQKRTEAREYKEFLELSKKFKE